VFGLKFETRIRPITGTFDFAKLDSTYIVHPVVAAPWREDVALRTSHRRETAGIVVAPLPPEPADEDQ
jgi:hypothetical protein